MKKLFIVVSMMLLCNFMFGLNGTDSISKEDVRLQFQEFSHPFIPDVTKMVVDVPLSLFFNDEFLSKTNTQIWYLASSPFLLPDPFYEIGFVAEHIIAGTEKATFGLGLGSALSQEYGITSIPLIISGTGKWFPKRWLEIELSLDNLLYGEGDIIDSHVMTTFKPFGFGLLFQLGFTGTLAYSWTRDILGNSYGISAGLGYLF